MELESMERLERWLGYSIEQLTMAKGWMRAECDQIITAEQIQAEADRLTRVANQLARLAEKSK